MNQPTELKIADQVWVCPKGHRVTVAGEAFEVYSVANKISTGAICPDCYVEWIAANVPKITIEKKDKPRRRRGDV